MSSTTAVPDEHLPALLACAETLARRHEKAAQAAEEREADADDPVEASRAHTTMLAAQFRAQPFRAMIADLSLPNGEEPTP